jgi:hypothetical protein
MNNTHATDEEWDAVDATERVAHLAWAALGLPADAFTLRPDDDLQPEALDDIIWHARMAGHGPDDAHINLWEACRAANTLGVHDLAERLIAVGMPWRDALDAAEACGCPSPLLTNATPLPAGTVNRR